MSQRQASLDRQRHQGNRLEGSSVLRAVGLLQSNPLPKRASPVQRSRSRGPVPRQCNVVGEQRCYCCGETKQLAEFCGDRSRPNGRCSRCKVCNRSRVKAYAKSPRGRARHRRYQLARAYGITVNQYAAMVREQGGKCAICGDEPKQFHVDHDHKTNEIRGLLCGNCNVGIGHFRDNPDLMTAAIKYLRRGNHGTRSSQGTAEARTQG